MGTTVQECLAPSRPPTSGTDVVPSSGARRRFPLSRDPAPRGLSSHREGSSRSCGRCGPSNHPGSFVAEVAHQRASDPTRWGRGAKSSCHSSGNEEGCPLQPASLGAQSQRTTSVNLTIKVNDGSRAVFVSKVHGGVVTAVCPKATAVLTCVTGGTTQSWPTSSE